MIFSQADTKRPFWRDNVLKNYRMDEDQLVEFLLKEATLSPEAVKSIQDQARVFVQAVRKGRRNQGGIDAFMQQYDLSTQEGLVLMCLAEALLRIPDAETADALIEDKLSGSHWEDYIGKSDSLFVNASTMGLMITGKILSESDHPQGKVKTIWHNLIKRSGEPVIRQAMRQAMRIMGFQFVLGRTIDEALKRAGDASAKGYRYSFDMLGEAARTKKAALAYFKSYEVAIAALTKDQKGRGPIAENGISVKLSALHPRYEMMNRQRVLDELAPMLLKLAQQAKAANIGFTIDAEEAARLELSLEVIEKVFEDPSLEGWEGFGVVVQAYQKRALNVLDMLAGLAERLNRKMMIRLVKGAYWDSEVKISQEQGLIDYPVFTRKSASDVSYMACAKKLLSKDCFYPQFATHNAYTVATILEMAKAGQAFEFQRLHGMGEPLYEQLVGKHAVRVYAPVGSHEDLLSYLVRRLLENGANSSFVNRLVDDNTPIEDIIQDPVAYLKSVHPKRHPHIPLPCDLYGAGRKNSKGVDLSDSLVLDQIDGQLSKFKLPTAVQEASAGDIEAALDAALTAQTSWNNTPAVKRAEILCRAADLFEQSQDEFIGFCIQEAGKTLADAIAEIREAVDFLRYYADRIVNHNEGKIQGRGTFVCISPWNFPLAIFIGQVSAALAAGNAVIAKPAEQTPLIALRAVELMYEAGLPKDVLHVLCGTGEAVGAPLINDLRTHGVCFTGSNETANIINRSLAARPGPRMPLIAETGGQNAMIIDSSALLEASVADVVMSAFGSAGQRCSALRVLYIQADVADDFIELLQGAMAELRLDNPALLSTDVGPVIDEDAHKNLQHHIDRMKQEAKFIASVEMSSDYRNGHFINPHAFEISSVNVIGREVFGPVLHLVRFGADQLEQVIEEINSTGFGLTCGVHSRIESRTRYIQSRIRAGNCYINRNMIGAVVGVQPFGGEGLSGTGPKAGGPHYLARFAKSSEQQAISAKDKNALSIASMDKFETDVTAFDLSQPVPFNGTGEFELALIEANNSQENWDRCMASARARILRKTADQLVSHKEALIARYMSESEKDFADCVGELGKAVHSLRNSANQCEDHMSAPEVMPGPTGEHNELQVHGRGTYACLGSTDVSLADLIGQMGAVLAAGNCCILQTTDKSSQSIGSIVKLFHDAGMPKNILHYVASTDARTTEALIKDQRIQGVCFAGSSDRIVEISRLLASRKGALTPLVTESEGADFLLRFVTERTMSVNITAAGGNASLLTLNENV
jgi:RHH-type transcriptional regulator, proline utilization regulon repressor / proline dehydrogenase / delta 1-pyrroline-5-carboxylate dehydrogenase